MAKAALAVLKWAGHEKLGPQVLNSAKLTLSRLNHLARKDHPRHM